MGLFITFEGIEGCGKTTQIELLAAWLETRGLGCVRTREPGGTAAGEAIRGIFLNSGHTELTALTELLLVTAARAQHLHEVVMPALNAGGIVVCDRFFDATAVYQGCAGGLDRDLIERSHELFCAGLRPDITLLLDCPVYLGLGRSRARNDEAGLSIAEGRFEDKDGDFHENVRLGYLERARREPGRFAIIDARASVEQMQRQIAACVGIKLREKGYAV